MLNRRTMLRSLGLAAIAGSSPGLAFAKATSESKLVLIVLRGAVDGLALAAPYGDGNYRSVRGELALSKPGTTEGLLKLDGTFGLHPSFENVYKSFAAGDASVIHAIASPYRSRSHFDGQDMLESGATSVGGRRDGWLNRALAHLENRTDDASAIAFSQNTPLILRGDNSVTSWAPSKLPHADDSTLERLQLLYADDEFFATRLQQALRSQEIAGMQSGMQAKKNRGNDAKQFADLMKSAALFLNTPDGPTIAVAELGGWDTHANQGAAQGSLANRFSALDLGLGNLRDGLGDSWEETVVIVVTEFGRTVRVNGTRGTDHGTATAALMMGGAVLGGKVITDWPGLGKNNLYAGRDLLPTTDVRSLFKAVLADHLKLPANLIERDVFPGSSTARPLENLIRT
jgi:uncharacterized protein (DUF1501 family)